MDNSICDDCRKTWYSNKKSSITDCSTGFKVFICKECANDPNNIDNFFEYSIEETNSLKKRIAILKKRKAKK